LAQEALVEPAQQAPLVEILFLGQLPLQVEEGLLGMALRGTQTVQVALEAEQDLQHTPELLVRRGKETQAGQTLARQAIAEAVAAERGLLAEMQPPLLRVTLAAWGAQVSSLPLQVLGFYTLAEVRAEVTRAL
jgi:hypothetical protein